MTVALTIGSTRHLGWTDATITRSLETISGSFSITLTERTPGANTARRINPGDACTVELQDTRVIRGYVDEVNPRYDAGSHSISVRGRDRTGDLVDCSAATMPGEWQNESLFNIVQQLVQPYGISVSLETNQGAVFRKFRIDEGETVFEAIERACRFRAVLPLSDGDGDLILGSPTRDRAAVRLERGVNILSAAGSATWLNRFSEYTLLGQQAGNDFLSAEEAAHVTATARDAGVTRHRPLTIIGEQSLDNDEAQARIDWEANVRAARARAAVVVVQGWRETPDGALWEPGKLVHIVDDWLGLDRELLIASTTHQISSNGELTTLQVMPREAFIQRAVTQREQARTNVNWWE